MKTKDLTFIALMIALAAVLNYLSGFIPLFKMPAGGSVTLLSSALIFSIGVRYGIVYGVTSGFIYGIINFISYAYVVHPVQMILDYFIAFMVLGLGSLFIRKPVSYKKLAISYFIVLILRLLASTISGVIFFAEYAGNQSVFMYAFIYNATYIIPEYFINIMVLTTPQFRKLINEYIIKI